jgi:hypothetical protein
VVVYRALATKARSKRGETYLGTVLSNRSSRAGSRGSRKRQTTSAGEVGGGWGLGVVEKLSGGEGISIRGIFAAMVGRGSAGSEGAVRLVVAMVGDGVVAARRLRDKISLSQVSSDS